MDLNEIYRVYSTYLKNKYGQKVYKLPVNIPCSCPNRDGRKGTQGCIFCGGSGSGFELLSENLSVSEQLLKNKELIQRKYKANNFIAYFQSFSNTYLNFDLFKRFMTEAAQFDNIIELSISTRPDCIEYKHIDFLNNLKEKTNTNITIELGLQSSNNKTLQILNRQHTVEDYINSAQLIKNNGLDLCTHIISDLPWDSKEDIVNLANLLNETQTDFLKVHSLYVERGTVLEKLYNNGLELLSSNDFIERTILLLELLNPNIVIERLIGRIPEKNCVYANWQQSWWKIRDLMIETMVKNSNFQGRRYTR